MEMEQKGLEFTNLKSEAKDRVRVGIAAVFGNVDSYDDRIHPGAFAKTLREGLPSQNIKFFFNHTAVPPFASIVDVKEISPAEMPSEIVNKYPAGTITGGLKVWREYYPASKNLMGENMLYALDKGDISQMSFAYTVVKADYSDEEIAPGVTKTIRELKEVKLYEISDVYHGANAETIANLKGFNIEAMPYGTLSYHFRLHQEELKAGRRNSSTDQTILDEMILQLLALGGKLPDAKEDEENTEKSDSEKTTKEAGADSITPLNSKEFFDLLKRKKQIFEF